MPLLNQLGSQQWLFLLSLVITSTAFWEFYEALKPVIVHFCRLLVPHSMEKLD